MKLSDTIELCPSVLFFRQTLKKSIFFKEYSFVFFSYVYPFLSCFENSEFSGSVQKSLSHVLLLLYYVLSLLHINWDQPVQMLCPSSPILSITWQRCNTLAEHTHLNPLGNTDFELHKGRTIHQRLFGIIFIF